MVFFTFSILDVFFDYGVYKTNCFFTFSILDVFFDYGVYKTNGSLNSLSVRVPHNLSSRVLQLHGPNPWLGKKGAFSLQFFKIMMAKTWRPNIFLYKTNGFFTFSILDVFFDYGVYKTNGFFTFSILVLFYDYGVYKTNCFFHFLDFSIGFRLRVYKTNGFFTFSILVLVYVR